MTLPVEKTKPKENLEDFIIFIYGIPKIGKSTFASKFSNPLFLKTEEGLRSLETFQVDIKNWQDYLNILEELSKNGNSFRTIVVDTADNLFLFCNDFVMKKHHIEHASDMEWGKGWEFLKTEFRKGVIRATQLGMGLIFISHSQEKEVRKTGQEPKTKITYTLPGHARNLITAMADMILFMTFEDGKRIIKTKPSEDFEAGDRTGKLPDSIPLNYDEFLNAFYSSKETLITRIKKAEAVLAEQKIDNFETEKRKVNSRVKHLGTQELDLATISTLQDYIQHLTLKYKGSKNDKNTKN